MIVAIYKDVLKSGRGADRATATVANALAAHGYAVHVVTKQSPGTPLSVTFDPRIAVHHVPLRKASAVVRFLNKVLLRSAFGAKVLGHLPRLDLQLRTSEALRKTLRTFAPDLILSEGLNEAIDLTYGGLPCAPFIQCFHIYPPVCFAKNKYQRVTRFCVALRKAVAVQVLLPSHEALLRPYTDAPIAVIGNVLPALLMGETLPERKHIIIYIAYFSKDKNHVQLLQAFARIRDRGDWQLHLYGSGTPEYERRLRACVKDLNLETCVVFKGVTDKPEEVLRTASVCAYPSLTEGFSLALLEAMWMGLPCVGLRTAPGVNELLTDGETGCLVDGTEAFAETLQKLMQDASLRKTLGEKASRFVRTTYTPERIWTQWEALLTSCASRS